MAVIIQDIIIPNQQGGSLSWINYHKALKSRFGKANAHTLFMHTWQVKGNDALPSEADFDAYFMEQGIDLKSSWDSVITGARSVSDGFSTVKTTVGVLIGAMAVAFLFGLLRMLVLKPDAAMQLIPAARAAKAARTAKMLGA